MANSAQLRNEIAAGKWDDKLRALYGDAAQEICRQRARYCAALEQFELYFGPGRQVQVYSAIMDSAHMQQPRKASVACLGWQPPSGAATTST